MRLAPIPMYFCASAADTFFYAGESTRTTHAAQEAIECSRLFGLQLRAALLGGSKKDILAVEVPEPLTQKVATIAAGEYIKKPRDEIHSSGYCVESLEAALWCFFKTESLEAAVLEAANLGGDADTTAAICGQMAGAYYGVSGIPASWLRQLAMRADIDALATRLYECSVGH
jgi:ADP-ribosyl-[dinitrogen reductase] hydrolase